MSISVVITPTHDWLREAASECTSRFLVSSPYVSSLLVSLTANLAPGVAKKVVTKTDLRDFAMGSSDVGALCDLASQGVAILSLRRLHAKVYVIDRSKALITSANATWGGMQRNWECGVAVDDPECVDHVAELLLSGFGAQETLQTWTFDELDSLRDPVRVLHDRMPHIQELPKMDTPRPPIIALGRKAKEALLDGFKGWMRLTLEGVLAQPDDSFTLDDLLASCAPAAAERYPHNQHVREKLRQQLQRLRDLGLVEFVGGGHYRRNVQQ